MAKSIMVLGTSSGAGKSTLVAGLCRIFYEEGLRVRPFKAQNMSNRGYVLDDGREIAKSQYIAAKACGQEPRVEMNPILLKLDQGSFQVVVLGEAEGSHRRDSFDEDKVKLWPVILNAYETLAAEADLVILEGAGSPVEMNLKEKDLANLNVARRVKAPVLLVADIHRGGVFASVVGTLALMTAEERSQVKGIVINRLMGDASRFQEVSDTMAAVTGLPVVGTLPYLKLDIEDEDGLSDGPLKGEQTEAALEKSLSKLAEDLRPHLDLEKIRQIWEAGL